MPAPRLPVAKAKALGADLKDPSRYAARKEPECVILGDATDVIANDEFALRAWEGFKREWPWLMESDRAMLEVCAQVRGRIFAGEDVGVTKLSMYQSIISKMGGSPSDRTKITTPDDDEEDEFFN